MKRHASFLGHLLILGIALHLTPSEFPFLSNSQGLSMQACWLPLRPYSGSLHPIFLSFLRLLPIGDIIFRTALTPLWTWLFFGCLASLFLAKRLTWGAPFLWAPLCLRLATLSSSLSIQSAPCLFLLVILFHGLSGTDASLQRSHSWYWFAAGLLAISTPTGPLLSLSLLVGLLVICPGERSRIPRGLALFFLGTTPWLGLLLRSRFPLACGLSTHGNAWFSLLSLLNVPPEIQGPRALLMEIKEVAQAVTWPLWTLGAVGLFMTKSRRRNLFFVLVWVFLATTSLPLSTFVGVALFFFGALEWTRWRLPEKKLGAKKWNLVLTAVVALCSASGLWIQKPSPCPRWPGRDRVARRLYAPARNNAVLLLSSPSSLRDAGYELFIRRDGTRWPGPKWLDRSFLTTLPGVWTFLQGCPPALRPTQEDLSRIISNAQGEGTAIRRDLLFNVASRAFNIGQGSPAEPSLYWELETPNDPFVRHLLPIHLWGRILREEAPSSPPESLKGLNMAGFPDANHFVALSLSRYAAFQLERAKKGLPVTDPGPILQAAKEREPTLAEIHYHLYQYLWEQGQQVEAVHALEEALRLSPHDAVYLSDMAWLLQNQDQFEAALAYYQRLLSERGKNPRILMDYAGCLAASGQTNRSIQILESLLRKTAPGNPLRLDILRNLGVWLTSTGRPQDALDCLEEARSLAPRDLEVLEAHAQALNSACMPREAIAVYQELLRTRPRDASLLVDLGVCHASLMEYDKAQRYWEEALLANPSFNEALLNLKELHNTLMYFDPERSMLPPELLGNIVGMPVKDSSCPPAEAPP